jgi:hypothetical protein
VGGTLGVGAGVVGTVAARPQLESERYFGFVDNPVNGPCSREQRLPLVLYLRAEREPPSFALYQFGVHDDELEISRDRPAVFHFQSTRDVRRGHQHTQRPKRVINSRGHHAPLHRSIWIEVCLENGKASDEPTVLRVKGQELALHGAKDRRRDAIFVHPIAQPSLNDIHD